MAFLNLPPLPAAVSADLRDKLETYRVDYFSDEEPRYEAAFTIAEELAAFQPAGEADLAAKLILALHQLAPGNQHDTLFQIDPSDILSVRAEQLLVACVNDAIRLAAVSEWERNLTAYRTAHDTYLLSLDLLSIGERHLESDSPAFRAIEAHSHAAMNAEVSAEQYLLATPAPDLAAALVKAEILKETQSDKDGMKALLADLTRLGKMGAAA